MGSNRKVNTPRGTSKKMRVVFISERRADYPEIRPTMKLMKDDPFFDYKLIVTGGSLLKQYGEDITYIRRDGFKIAQIIPMHKGRSADSGAEMIRGYGRVLIEFADAFEKLKPDLIMAGSDIGANLCAAIAGAHMNIHVAHIQGGEVTGSIDESIRHAMTKFSHIHFPTTDISVKRLRRMGENPKYIFKVGSTSIDGLIQAPRLSRDQMAKEFGIDPKKPYILVVQHPVTTEVLQSGLQMRETLRAIQQTRAQAVVFYPNNDAGTSGILREIKNTRIKTVKSVSPELFANALRHCAALVGNSSSGIHEAALFHIPVVNIGSRQQGREHGKNVIDVGHDKNAIVRAINKALYDKKFKAIIKKSKNIYGDGHSAEKIIAILKKLDLKKVPLQKKFVD